MSDTAAELVPILDVTRVVNAWLGSADVDSAEAREVVADFRAALAQADDDTVISLFAQAWAIEENLAAPYRWGRAAISADIERRLLERRAQRGPNDTAPIYIPHPRVEVVNEAEHDAYQVDIDQLEEAFRGLSDDERAELLVITPAHVIPESVRPAEFVERSVRVRHMQTLLAWIKRNAGSPAAIIAKAAITRNYRGSKTTIRPKPKAAPRRGAL